MFLNRYTVTIISGLRGSGNGDCLEMFGQCRGIRHLPESWTIFKSMKGRVTRNYMPPKRLMPWGLWTIHTSASRLTYSQSLTRPERIMGWNFLTSDVRGPNSGVSNSIPVALIDLSSADSTGFKPSFLLSSSLPSRSLWAPSTMLLRYNVFAFAALHLLVNAQAPPPPAVIVCIAIQVTPTLKSFVLTRWTLGIKEPFIPQKPWLLQ